MYLFEWKIIWKSFIEPICVGLIVLFLHCPLNGSLGKQQWFFYCITTREKK